MLQKEKRLEMEQPLVSSSCGRIPRVGEKRWEGEEKSLKLIGCQLSSFPPTCLPDIPVGKSVV